MLLMMMMLAQALQTALCAPAQFWPLARVSAEFGDVSF